MIGACFVLILAGSLVLLREVSRSSRIDSKFNDISFSAGMALLLGAVLTRFLMLDLLRHNGFVLFTMDEASRWHLSWLWSRSPYFFTSWDGVWLTGGFAYYGIWMKLLGSPAIGAHAGATVAAIATIGAAYFLARVLSGKNLIGAVAAWLFAPQYHFLWFGHGALAESLLAGLFMSALAMGVLWFHAESQRTRMQYAAAASAFIFLASTVHYVAWMAFAVGLLIMFAALARARKFGTHGATAVWMIISGTAFPIFWMAVSQQQLGHPLAFLINQKNVMAELGSRYAPGTTLFSNFMLFPIVLAAQTGPLLLPLLILLPRTAKNPRLSGGIKIAGYYAAALLALMSVLVAGNFYGIPERNMTIVLSLVFIAAAISAGAVAHLWRGFRSVMFLAIFAIGAGWFGYNALTANRFEKAGASELDKELIALGTWLKLQARRPETLTHFNPQSKIGFSDFYYADENLLLLEFISGVPERLVMVPPGDLDSGALPEMDYLISSLNAQPAGYGLIHTFGKWRIYEPAEQ